MKIRLLLLAVLIIILAACSRQDAQEKQEETAVNPAKLTTVYDGAVDKFKEEYKGKVLLVNFFSAACPPCRAETPGFVKVYNENKERFAIVGLTVDKNDKVMQEFLNKYNVSYPVYKSDDRLSMKFGIATIPTNIIYSPDGKLVDIVVGQIPEQELIAIIDKLTK